MTDVYLGVDLGSSYTKFAVVNDQARVIFRSVIPTLSRKRQAFDEQLATIKAQFRIIHSCATGYGRNSFDADLKKTELVCASAGLVTPTPMTKTIIDIGGEDTKVIESGPNGEVLSFFMNDKCAAGTGSFITEIAEKAELEIEEMSGLAAQSQTKRTMNSFCTVFAKSEILGWKFEGVPIEDIARGIYLSIVDRIAKLPRKHGLPIFLTGGVVAYHPYLEVMIADRLGGEPLGGDVTVALEPQSVVAVGAALLALKAHQN